MDGYRENMIILYQERTVMEPNKGDNRVSEIIRESWERCRAFGVDREHGKGKRVSEPEMDEIFKRTKAS